MKKRYLLMLALLPAFVEAQTLGDYRSNAATFNWNATASWQRWNGSAWISNPGEGFPGQNVSGIAGTVTLQAGHAVTLNVTPGQPIGNLVISATATLSAGAQTLQLTGDFTNNGGTFTPATSTFTFSGTTDQAITGTPAAQTFNNIIVNKSSGALNVSGSTTTLNVAAFTLTLGSFNAPATFAATGTITLTAGTFTAGANVNASANFTNNGGTFVPGSGTVTFTGSAAQQINGSAAAQSFNNIVVNKTGGSLATGGSTVTLNIVNLTRTAGTFTAPATVNISGNLVLTAGTYTAGANTNLSGNFTNNGGIFTAGANTFTFNGTGDQVIDGALTTVGFGNIVINKTAGTTLSVGGSVSTVNAVAFTLTQGNFNAPATFAATGTITLTAGTFTAGANVNASANFTNNGGTFVPGSGTVTFTGGAPQVIGGTAIAQSFNNLVVNKSANALATGGSTTTINVNAFTQTTGNFTAPATFNGTGAFTLTAGTFTAGANTSLEGDFNGNGGTFSAGSNTITFAGSGAKTIAGSSGTTATFFNMIVSAGSVLFGSSTGARTLTVTGNLTISGGSFLSGPTGGNPHTINLTGNLANAGTLNFSDNGATGHRLIFTGTGAKTLSGSGSSTVQSLRMSTTGGAVLNVNSNLRVNGTLDWTADGLLILGAADFTFGNTAAVAAPSATRYIRSDGTSALTGQVIKINNGTTATWQFLFPIGTTSVGYSPLDLTTATITNAPTINSSLAAKAIVGVDEPGKLKRVFRLQVAGNGIATTFTNGRFNYYNPTDVSGVEPIVSYNTFWYQRESTGIWTRPGGIAPGTVNTAPTLSFFTAPSVAQPLTNDTYYFTIGTPGAYGQIWYSYQTGNWNDPLTWTTDGSAFPLYVNPTNAIPGVADEVVIKSGQTVTMNINNVTINSIDVIGTLNVAATTGHNLTAISGSGRIRVAGASDNFPAGSVTSFADNAVGGTVEFYGASILLNQARTFNNMEVNMADTTNAAVLKNNYTLNGDLTITRGLLQFENATAPANRTFTVNGHVTVAGSGGIRTGTTNNRHEFDLFGDFTNNGTCYFTNRITPNYAAEATDGIVDVNFRSSARDQQVTCDGETRFYRVEINKGTDDTFKASISASTSANFALLGFANEDHAAVAQLTGNANALGLIFGTVELGANVVVPVLSTAGNYNISEGAQLWVNGGTLNKNTGNSLVPYGRLRVTAGVLTANVVAGITTRDGGSILVEGGTVTANQIRTSILGPTNVGSYIQSGGTVTVDGDGPGGTGLDFYVFSLTYTGNVFNMSGGDLIVRGARSGTGGTRGAIYINSDPANVSVTGGRIIFEISNNNVYRVTSRAPFWNVLMRRTAGTATVVELNTGDSGSGAGQTSISPVQPLVVLNDFLIESPVNFTTNNANVTVAGDFGIQNGATYTFGTNTTTIDGPGVSSFVFGSTTATQQFNNLVINKANAANEVVVAAGRPGPAAALQINGSLTVTRGIFDYGSFVVSSRASVSLASATVVGKAASTGRLLLNGPSAQTLGSSQASIHNLEIDNSNGVVLATDDFTVLRTLTLTNGVFNIGTFKLTLSGPSASIAGSGFSAAKMIQTAANTSDGGLELYLDANETLSYPIGVAGKYTPVTAAFTGFSDDGFIKINPVNGVLQTTNLSGGPDILAYYWRVGSSGFTVRPTVSYTFQYVVGDVGGTESNYVPGKVLDLSPFTRSSETPASKVNTTTKVITFNGSGSGFQLEEANYTAGGPTRFTGTPTVYYTRVFGDGNTIAWTTASNWTLGLNASFPVHDSRQTPAAAVPGPGDIAVVGYVPFSNPADIAVHGRPHGIAINNNVTVNVAELRFTQMRDAANNPTARIYAFNFQFRPCVVFNNTGVQGRLINAKVSGEGMFWIRSSSTLANLSDPSFATVDLGDFNANDSSYVVYENNVNGATYNNMASTFPNLMMATNGWGNQNHDTTIPNTITVNGDLEILGNINLVLSTGATGDITVRRRLRFFRSNANGNDSGGGGELRFGNTGTPRTVTVLGDLLLGNGSAWAADIRVLTPGTTPLTHTFSLHGNFLQNTSGGNGFRGGTVATQDRIHVNLLGSNSMVLTNTSGNAPQFYSLTVNKGTSIATTASFNSVFTIDGPTNTSTKALTLTNGLFIINSAANIVLTSGGGDFAIPATAGLQVSAGTARTSTTTTGANVLLDGLLRVSGGTVTIDGGGAADNNSIQYSNSGSAAVEVTGGTLTVAGQIRRDLTSTSGVVRYTQSGGTVIVGNEGVSTALRGVFEVVNPGSQFNHSGGSLTIVRGNGSASVPSLWLEPGSSSITSGSTITIGNASTPAGTIGIQSAPSLNNLTIAGLAASAPQISMYTTSLAVAGNLTVATGNTLNALSRDLTIGGNFTVNGSYLPGTNTTTFNNAGAANIGGAVSALSFHNFTKVAGGALTLARDVTVSRDLRVSAGELATATFSVNLLRHAEIDAIVSSTAGNGLIFGGTAAQQQLTRSVAGTGTLGIVTINNPNGVIVPDGNGFDFAINTNLRMQSGIFDIGGSLLSLGVAALITPVNPFSAANLIQTNSSFTDKGVRKQFPTSYTTDFVFPVGQSFYTPVTFRFSAGTSGTSGTPTITVRPSNRIHPVIVNDNDPGELPDPITFNDLNNVLQYYWIVTATGVSSSFSTDMLMQYTQPLVSVVSPYSEANYITAQILTDPSINPLLNINKFSTAQVNEITNVLTFALTSVVDGRSITGDYFAGVGLAIPNNIPTYTTVMSGNVGDNIYDQPVFGGIPAGARVIVDTGHNVTFNTGSVIIYQTVIRPGASITIPSGSVGHSLGTLSGTGNLEINSDDASAVLPAAVYDTFFSCAGGGLIFGGSGSYEILGGITLLRNLTLNGSGDKSLANNNITICNDLTVNNGAFFNSSNRIITIQNDMLLNGGLFGNSAGTLTITRDFTQASGTFAGGTGGTKTISRNLTANGGTFNPGSGTANVIRVNGNMTVAGGATISTGLGGATGQRFLFAGAGTQTITGSFTGSRAFNRLEISNAAGLMLNGDVTVANQLLLTNGLITPSGTFLLAGPATVLPLVGSASSFVNGKLFKTIATAGQSFDFPIGKGTRWRSAALLGVNVGGVTWDMEYFGTIATGVVAVAPPPRSNPINNFTSSDPLILRLSGAEYWRVSDGSALSSGRTARVGLSWGVESDVSPVLTQREDLRVMSWNGTNWTNHGGTIFAPGGAHTQARGTFQSSTVLSFSENIVTLGSTQTANPLPVELDRFEARLTGTQVELFWRTASELNNDYFEVQRSPDGVEYQSLGRVAGKGTTNKTNSYFFVDAEPAIGFNYYRLKQVDLDGEASYSEVRRILYDGSVRLAVRVHPNPTEVTNINLKVFGSPEKAITIRLFDLQGRVHFQKTYASAEELSETALRVEASLPAGVYLVEATQERQRVAERLVIR